MTENQIRDLQTWAVLVVAAVRKETVTYGELRLGLGYDPDGNAGEQTRYHLGAVQDFCLEMGEENRLTSLVVSKGGGTGKGFNKPPDKTVEECQQEVFAYGKVWFKHHKAFCEWVEKNRK